MYQCLAKIIWQTAVKIKQNSVLCFQIKPFLLYLTARSFAQDKTCCLYNLMMKIKRQNDIDFKPKMWCIIYVIISESH